MSRAIIIGAGHNGLVAGLLLARAGRTVTVVEQRGEVGGLCAASEVHPGYTVPGLLHDSTGVRREVVESLGLSRFGLAFDVDRAVVDRQCLRAVDDRPPERVGDTDPHLESTRVSRFVAEQHEVEWFVRLEFADRRSERTARSLRVPFVVL